MAIDPNIALGVRPIELPNQLAQYGQLAAIQNAQNQNALAQYQLEAAKRQEVAQNAMGAAWRSAFNPTTGEIDQNALFRNMAEGGAAHLIPDTQAKLLESKSKAATLKKTETETSAAEFKLMNDKLKHGWQSLGSAPTPQVAIDKLTEGVQKGYFSMADAAKEIKDLKAITSPEGYRAWRLGKLEQLMDAKDQYQAQLPKTKLLDTGSGYTPIQDNPALPGYGLPVQGMTPIQKTMTLSEIEANKIARGNLAVNQGQLQLARENATKPVFNAQAGGFISPPSAAKPQGEFIPAPEIQSTKDQQAAVKALQSAGYDPITGEDTISKLIAKSTSGGLNTGTSAVAAFFGKSTEGRRAIAALEGTANQIATDLAGGKLGAGISNTDREFIVSALGDVANPMKPAGDRLAGWNAAKERMMRVGLIPPPKVAEPAPTASPQPVVRTPQTNVITNPQFPGFSISPGKP